VTSPKRGRQQAREKENFLIGATGLRRGGGRYNLQPILRVAKKESLEARKRKTLGMVGAAETEVRLNSDGIISQPQKNRKETIQKAWRGPEKRNDGGADGITGEYSISGAWSRWVAMYWVAEKETVREEVDEDARRNCSVC